MILRRSPYYRLAAALVVALGLAAAGLGLFAPAGAAPLSHAVIAVIDYQKVLRDSAASRSIRDQLETRRRGFQDEIAAQEQRLHEADKELARQRTLLAPEAFAERQRAFEQDVTEVQRMVQERRRQLEEVSAVALDQVREVLVEVVADLAQEKEFNIVLPSSTLFVYSPSLDITDEAMSRLDSKLPDVRVPEQPE